MSNCAYGYVLTSHVERVSQLLEAAAQRANIGLEFIADRELFNFPDASLPRTPHVTFLLGDRPGKNTVTYLADLIDYAPDASIGLPLRGEDRLAILIDWLVEVAKEPDVVLLAIAICESNEIEEQVQVPVGRARARMQDDFIQYAPPNKLYIITK